MARCLLPALLASTLIACTPVAVGAVVVGGTTTAVGGRSAAKSCDGEGEGCKYEQALGLLVVVLGLTLAAGGGLYLAVD